MIFNRDINVEIKYKWVIFNSSQCVVAIRQGVVNIQSNKLTNMVDCCLVLYFGEALVL